MADLHRAGVKLRKPPIFKRVGIPGSGGPDWWRNDYEFVICSSKGKLPWSDNTAMGHPPKYAPGGAPSHRTKDGSRVNRTPSQKQRTDGAKGSGSYKPPTKANPGNVIECHGGGGHMGSKHAHSNEAPFPEKLAQAFIVSFCPPGGLVVDPFSGSGTTVCVAAKLGRSGIGIDIRDQQNVIAKQRLREVFDVAGG
jgi:DNA modification methylase